MNNLKKWKKQNKFPACTEAPWKKLIPEGIRYEVLRKIRQECIEYLGYTLDECPKRKVCLKKKCLGRPLPWFSKTAKPYLEKLRKHTKIENKELFIDTDCSKCPVFNECKKPCPQILDYISRDKSREPLINYKDHVENTSYKTIKNTSLQNFLSRKDLPWYILSENKKKIVNMYLFKSNDFRHIADTLNINNESRAKYEFYAALTKLSEYAIMIAWLRDNSDKLSKTEKKVLPEYYINHKPPKLIAKELNMSIPSVYKVRSRAIEKYNIKWPVFVKKNGNKVQYNVPEVFR